MPHPKKSFKDYVELDPYRGDPGEWDEIERRILKLFLEEIYYPLLKQIERPRRVLNAKEDDSLFLALQSGRVTFSRGTFSGKFSAGVTRELKKLGATWDRKSGTFKIPFNDLPTEMKFAVSTSQSKFLEKLEKIDRALADVSPEKLADALKLTDKFDSALFKVDSHFHKNVEGLLIAPKLTPEQKKKISEDWQNNMRLYIKDFTEEEIKKLRGSVRASVFAGDRYGSLVDSIKKSYGVTENKAKFLARQETKLMVNTFQEARYQDAGVDEYHWYHVAGSPAHPVRPQHFKLGEAKEKDGSKKVYRFSDPPITSEPNQPVRRNNPGKDYNCRCFSKAVVRFKR